MSVKKYNMFLLKDESFFSSYEFQLFLRIIFLQFKNIKLSTKLDCDIIVL